MIITKVWFFLAALILLDISPSWAVSYVRVNQKGVIYYYFNNRTGANPELTSVKPPAENNPRLQKVVPSQGPAPRLQLPLVPVTAPNPTVLNARLSVETLLPRTGPSTLNPGDLMAAAGSADSPESNDQDQRSILKLFTKLSFFDPPCLAPEEDQNYFPGHTCFQVPDVWAKAPKYFQASPPKSQLSAAPSVTLPLPALPPLPRYACQPRLWGRVTSGGSFKPSTSQYYCFPVASPFTFRDSWGDPRPNGRIHRAVDVFAPEGTALYAITAGTIQSLATSESGGIMLMLRGNDGRGYGYMHLMAYAEGIEVGKAVRAGELIGYMGRTGCKSSPAHLHIQVYPDHQFSHETLVDPYDFLVQLCRGIGVTDLNQPRVARQQQQQQQHINQVRIAQHFNPMAKNKNSKIKWIQVYQRPWPKGLSDKPLKLGLTSSPITVIRNN